MTNLRTLLVLIPLFFLGACGSEAGAAGKGTDVATAAASITKLLGGITDGTTAEAAKGELGTLTDKLSGALGALKSATGSGVGDAAGKLGDMAKSALGALTPELTKSLGGLKDQVTKLLGNADIVKAIGPILEKLKGVLPQ